VAGHRADRHTQGFAGLAGAGDRPICLTPFEPFNGLHYSHRRIGLAELQDLPRVFSRLLSIQFRLITFRVIVPTQPCVYYNKLCGIGANELMAFKFRYIDGFRASS